MTRRFWRPVALVLVPLMVGALWPTSAVAGGTDPTPPPPSDPTFTCRASVARVTTSLLPGLVVEPFVANAPGDPCVAEDTGLLNDADLAGLGTASIAFARTGVSASQSSAASGVADVTLAVAGLTLRAEVLTSTATASCSAGDAVLDGSSRVVSLSVNGQSVAVPPGNEAMDIALPGGIVVHLNQTVTTADQVTQRAVSVETPLVDVVVAESVADVHGCPGDDGKGKGGDDGKGKGGDAGKGKGGDAGKGEEKAKGGSGGKGKGGDKAKAGAGKGKGGDKAKAGAGGEEKAKAKAGAGAGKGDGGKGKGQLKAKGGGKGGGAQKPQCSDGKDNDGDKKVDHPADPGCTGPDDDDEADGPATGARFTCRASVARVAFREVLPELIVEPFVANEAGDPCVAEDTGLLNHVDLAGVGTASVAFARTGVSSNQSSAESGVADVNLAVAGQTVRARVLTSRATASCAAGAPVLDGSSRVVSVTVNGREIALPADNAAVDVVVAEDIVLHLNQTVTTADQVTQRALFLRTPLVDVVVAESVADVHGCPGGNGGGKGGGKGKVTPGTGKGGAPQCSDGKDNDGDKKVDHPADPGCTGPDDDDEADRPSAGPTFTCRASVARVAFREVLPTLTVEPFVANEAGDPCVADDTGLLHDADLAGLGTASVAYARTGVSSNQSTAESGVADVTLAVAGQTLRATVLTSRATASCAAGGAVLNGSSRVVSLTVNGQEIALPADNAAVDVVVAEGIVLHLNQTVTTADQVTQRALFLRTPLVDVVVAEAVADVHGCPGGNGGKKGS